MRQKKPLFNTEEMYVSQEVLEHIVEYVSLLTSFGTRKLNRRTEILDHNIKSLPGGLLHSLHSYDLQLGLKLMRAMNYLHLCNHWTFRELIGFIIFHQRDEGNIGFFAPELLQLHKLDHKFVDSRDLYLPVTTHFLWTMAETINPKFRLFSI
jgi:hypothetical protein